MIISVSIWNFNDPPVPQFVVIASSHNLAIMILMGLYHMRTRPSLDLPWQERYRQAIERDVIEQRWIEENLGSPLGLLRCILNPMNWIAVVKWILGALRDMGYAVIAPP